MSLYSDRILRFSKIAWFFSLAWFFLFIFANNAYPDSRNTYVIVSDQNQRAAEYYKAANEFLGDNVTMGPPVDSNNGYKQEDSSFEQVQKYNAQFNAISSLALPHPKISQILILDTIDRVNAKTLIPDRRGSIKINGVDDSIRRVHGYV